MERRRTIPLCVPAMALLLLMASAFSASAQTYEETLAAYQRGDYATAYRGLRIHAARGNASAQIYLGFMYVTGTGIPQDRAEAAKWFRKAANQGNAIAQFNLGLMYNKGEGVSQDHAEAVKWYRKAADQGDADAQSYLGLMYYKGQGVPQDFVQAYLWLNLSASRRSDKRVQELRDEVAARLTPADLALAQRLAREWRPRTEVPRVE